MAKAATTQPSRLSPKERVPIEDRARRYLAKIPPAVSGQKGHDQTFHAACVLVIGFNLEAYTAAKLLGEWNQSCQPPWSDKDLNRKLNQALNQKDKSPHDVGRLIGNDEPIHRPSTRPSRAPSGAEKTSRTSFDARDAPLTRASAQSNGFGLGDELEVDASVFLEDAAPVEQPPASGTSPAEPVLPAPEPEAAPAVAQGVVAEVYGSKQRLWRMIQNEMAGAGCRWKTKEMRWPNILAVDPRVYPALPRVIDGMIVSRTGPEAGVEIRYCVGARIEGGEPRGY